MSISLHHELNLLRMLTCLYASCRELMLSAVAYLLLPALQECAGLQATGVADARTWKALLGAEAELAHLADLKADDATDEDLSEIGDRVWLLGEQRWARKL